MFQLAHTNMSQLAHTTTRPAGYTLTSNLNSISPWWRYMQEPGHILVRFKLIVEPDDDGSMQVHDDHGARYLKLMVEPKRT